MTILITHRSQPCHEVIHTSTPAIATPATRTVSDRNPSPDQQNATPDTPGADTTALGYDTQWTCLRAADAGTPHRRDRIFILCRDSRRMDFRCQPGFPGVS
jgi:hypothetical protein